MGETPPTAAAQISNKQSLTPSQVRVSLLQRARAAQEKNGHTSEATDKEICQLLRQLYERIVPSAVEERGNAQNANAFLSCLTKAKSIGFMSIFDKVGAVPSSVDGVRTGEVEATTQASS